MQQPVIAQVGPPLSGTGLEWMPVATFLLATLLLALILWFGSRNTV